MHQTDSAFYEVEVVLDRAVFDFAEVGVPTDVDILVVSNVNNRSDVWEFRGTATVYFQPNLHAEVCSEFATLSQRQSDLFPVSFQQALLQGAHSDAL